MKPLAPLILLLVLTACHRMNSAHENPSLQLQMWADREALWIINQSSSAVPAATIYINGHWPDAYHCTVANLKAGTNFVELANFVQTDGKRFRPDEFGVTNVWVTDNGEDFNGYIFPHP